MYVSTVDSGNLAAHLLTLRVGLLALADQPILPWRVFEGLADTLGVMRESRADDVSAPYTDFERELDSAVAAGITTLDDACRRLYRLEKLAGELSTGVGHRGGRHRSTAGLGPRAARPVPGRAR